MSDLIAKPNGFAAHEAIRRIREATETLHAFFGIDPEDGVAFHVAAPDAGWYRQDNYVFIDAHLLCEANSPDALLGRWTVLEEHRRGDLVHLRLETDSWEIHYIVYASAEIRNPDALEQIKRLERWPESAPKKDEARGLFAIEILGLRPRALTHEQIRNDLALCRYAWWHMYFASLESDARIYDALDKHWFRHGDALYVRHYNDNILCWMRLDIKQEHRKGGIVYFHTAEPDGEQELCALHSEALEVHDPSEQEAARKEVGNTAENANHSENIQEREGRLIRSALESHEAVLISVHHYFTGAENNQARIWMQAGTWWFTETHDDIGELNTLYVQGPNNKWVSLSLDRQPIRKGGMCYLVIDEHDDVRYVVVDADFELPESHHAQRQEAIDEAENGD